MPGASRDYDRSVANGVSVEQSGLELWRSPVAMRAYRVTSRFEMRWGAHHDGYDLAFPEGTPVIAPAPGKVILSRWNGGYGYEVSVDHGDGVITIYGKIHHRFNRKHKAFEVNGFTFVRDGVRRINFTLIRIRYSGIGNRQAFGFLVTQNNYEFFLVGLQDLGGRA